MSDEAPVPKIPRDKLSPWPSIGLMVVIVIALCGLGASLRAFWVSERHIPQQTQAAAVALPSPVYKFQSAIVFYTCRLLTGIIFVDFQGVLHPIDPTYISKLNVNQALTLLSQAPSGHILGVQAPCTKDSVTL